MIDPVSTSNPASVGPLAPTGATRPSTAPTAATPGGDDFATALRSQLEQVSAMQADADRNVESLLTGQSQNITEVFVAARKAQVAFSLLMEIRNKLVDAYTDLRQLRV